MASADLIMKLRGQDDLSRTLQGVKAELSDTEKKALKLDLIKKEFDRIKDSSMPLKRQLRQVKELLGEMNMQGLNKNDLFRTMTQQAGEMSDSMADANQAVAAFANDTMNLEASAQALQLVAGGASLVTGAMGLLGIEDEKVQQAMLKVQSAISLVNGVTAIANVLNKDSILMLRIKKIMMDANTASTATNTVAEGANAAATGISTVARNAWNVTVAIGKALLGDFSGLVLVAAAGLVTYALCTDDSTDSQEKHNKAVSDGQKIEQDYSKKVSSSTGELVGKYQVLRREWLSLKTTAEKTKWIENNQSAMDSLGLSVNNLSDAENVFVENTSRVVAALEARAKAEAAQQALVETYKKYYEQKNRHDTSTGDYYYKVKPGDKINQDEAKAAGLGKGDGSGWTSYTLTKQGAAKVNAYRNRQAVQKKNQRNNKLDTDLKKSTDFYTDIIVDNTAIANKTLASGKKTGKHSTKGGGHTTKTTPKTTPNPDKTEVYNPDSLKGLEQHLSKLQEEQGKLNPLNTDAVEKYKNAIEETKKKIEQTKIKLGIEVDEKADENSLDALEDKLKELEDKRTKINVDDTDSISKINADIDVMKKDIEKKKIKLGIETEKSEPTIKAEKESDNYTKGSNEDKRLSYNNAQTKVSTMKQDFEIGIIGKDEFDSQLKDLNKQLEDLGLQKIDLEVDDDGTIVDTSDRLKELKETLANVTQSMSGECGQMIEQFAQLAEILGDENADSATKAAAGLVTMGGALQKIGGDGMVAKVGAVMAAIGQIILGFATASAQAAALGPFGWLAFVGAGLATVATTISTLKGFAEGGIIEGASHSGDKIVARVNAGEMVLNKRQQSNLFNLLDGNGIGQNANGGKVEFVIKGSALKGVLNNYNDRMNKL